MTSVIFTGRRDRLEGSMAQAEWSQVQDAGKTSYQPSSLVTIKDPGKTKTKKYQPWYRYQVVTSLLPALFPIRGGDEKKEISRPPTTMSFHPLDSTPRGRRTGTRHNNRRSEAALLCASSPDAGLMLRAFRIQQLTQKSSESRNMFRSRSNPSPSGEAILERSPERASTQFANSISFTLIDSACILLPCSRCCCALLHWFKRPPSLR
jgi:hypothetical protein